MNLKLQKPNRRSTEEFLFTCSTVCDRLEMVKRGISIKLGVGNARQKQDSLTTLLQFGVLQKLATYWCFREVQIRSIDSDCCSFRGVGPDSVRLDLLRKVDDGVLS